MTPSSTDEGSRGAIRICCQQPCWSWPQTHENRSQESISVNIRQRFFSISQKTDLHLALFLNSVSLAKQSAVPYLTANQVQEHSYASNALSANRHSPVPGQTCNFGRITDAQSLFMSCQLVFLPTAVLFALQSTLSILDLPVFNLRGLLPALQCRNAQMRRFSHQMFPTWHICIAQDGPHEPGGPIVPNNEQKSEKRHFSASPRVPFIPTSNWAGRKPSIPAVPEISINTDSWILVCVFKHQEYRYLGY